MCSKNIKVIYKYDNNYLNKFINIAIKEQEIDVIFINNNFGSVIESKTFNFLNKIDLDKKLIELENTYINKLNYKKSLKLFYDKKNKKKIYVYDKNKYIDSDIINNNFNYEINIPSTKIIKEKLYQDIFHHIKQNSNFNKTKKIKKRKNKSKFNNFKPNLKDNDKDILEEIVELKVNNYHKNSNIDSIRI